MSRSILYAFIGGTLAGAAAALLLAPEKGVELRERIKSILKRRGLCCCDNDVDELVEQLTAEIED